MRVLHVIPSIAAAHGGPSAAVAAMAEGLADRGIAVTVATTDDAGPGHRMSDVDQAAALARFGVRGIELVLQRKDTEFYKVSTGLARWLSEHAGEFDVVHVHALFSFSSIMAARSAARLGVPYIVRPLGVLDAYGLRQRRPGLKRLSLALLDGPALRNAAAVHVTSVAEAENAKGLVDPARVHVLPLGVSPPQRMERIAAANLLVLPADGPRLLFLSRLDPKKNVEGLLKALASISGRAPAPRLVIAGGGEAGYVAELKRLAANLGVGDRVTWLGPVAGERKAAAWACADIFVLASHTENFGIAAAEALLAGLPCVLGEGVALARDAGAAGAAVVTASEPKAIGEAIAGLLEDPGGAWNMGDCAADFARDHYSIAAMAERLEALYRRVMRSNADGQMAAA